MGLFDKLKNVFFEEEYVEVEEPVKKEKVTVAKKIENPEIKEIKKIKEEIKPKVEKEPASEEKKEFPKQPEHDFKFPMDFDDKDFEVEEKKVIPPKEVVVEAESVYVRGKVMYEEPIVDYHNTNYQGLYEGSEKKDKKVGFSPSPIISPIYGILDKNYKKEQIVTKKEIRLSVTPKKVDLDYVREKAYGDLANDITASIHEEVKSNNDKKVNNDDLLYDLSEEDSPAVKVVTVGDAEEYFNDLGLEYNVDYKVEQEKRDDKEKSKENITRRTQKKHDIDIKDEYDSDNSDVTVENKKDDDDCNLFDLIDSMYEDKE